MATAQKMPLRSILLYLYNFLEESIFPADATEVQKNRILDYSVEQYPDFSIFRDVLKKEVVQ